MNGREFVGLTRRYARRNGLSFDFDPTRGKGNHGEVYIGEFRTTVQNGEIPRGPLASMPRDLDIDRREF